MKKINFNWFLSLMLGTVVALQSTAVFAQQTDKELKKEIKSKAVKEARKEAKRYAKEGWHVAPGALPMDKQIENSWMRQYQENEKGEPAYLISNGNSVAGAQQAAKLQATELAKLELAGLVQTSVAALIENSVATSQLSAEEAATVQETVAASKNIIAQEIGKVQLIVELYRKVGDNIESTVRVAYNQALANETAKKVIKQQLEDKLKITHDKLEKIMNF